MRAVVTYPPPPPTAATLSTLVEAKSAREYQSLGTGQGFTFTVAGMALVPIIQISLSCVSC